MSDKNWQEWSDLQRKNYVDTIQIDDALRAAREQARNFTGSMGWQKTAGSEYLVRSNSSGSRKSGLGVRSPETEDILDRFLNGKQSSKERIASISERMGVQARVNRAVNLARTPLLVAGISRALSAAGFLGKQVMLLGTNCLHAYETACGISLLSDTLATADADFLWDPRSPIKIAKLAGDLPADHLLRLVQKVDPSLEPIHRGSFRLVNKNGYMVDLIRADRNDQEVRLDPVGSKQGEHWRPVEIHNLKWLLSSPKFEVRTIGVDGMSTPLCVPDPRAYALYKLWLSRSDERDPIKRPRDLSQAHLVARITQEYLPHLPMEVEQMKMFPQVVASAFSEASKEFSQG